MFAGIGNIWDFESIATRIVIPTNIGWARGKTQAKSVYNVMGRGLAKDAASRYRHLDIWYGHVCRKYKEDTPVIEHPKYPVILFPVKPLNRKNPWFSWKSQADLGLIEKSCAQLATLRTKAGMIYIPLVGCGNGGLEFEQVYPVMSKYLNHPDRFSLVLEKSNQTRLLDYRVAHKDEEAAFVKCGVKSCNNKVEWGSTEWTKQWCYHWVEKLNKSVVLCPDHTKRILARKEKGL